MKNNSHKKKINKKITIIAVIIILLLITMLFMLLKTNSNNNTINEIAQAKALNYSIEVGTNNTIINFDKLMAKTNDEVNAPKMGAGMIPIIDIGNGMYEIVATDSTNWYNYVNGKPAYMMLSDGYYKAEIEQGIIEDQIATVGTQVLDNQLGTMYVWIPRFAYCENNIGFLKGTGIINASNWVTPEIFTVQATNNDFNIELTGIWVEKGTQESSTKTEEKIVSMNNIDNTYGLIANEKVEKLDESTKQILDIYNTYYNLETYIQDYNNLNRTYIKVTNTNQRQELVAQAYLSGKKVSIKIKKNDYEIEKIVNAMTGETLSGYEYESQKAGGFYSFIVIDTKGNMVTCSCRA